MQTTLILLNDGRNILVSNEQPKGGDYVLREDYSVNIWTKGISMGYLHTHPSKLPKVIIAGIDSLPTLTYSEEVKQILRDKYGWVDVEELAYNYYSENEKYSTVDTFHFNNGVKAHQSSTNKMFSLEDMRKCWNYAGNWFDEPQSAIVGFDNFIQSLQQPIQLKVEVEMIHCGYRDTINNECVNCRTPKLEGFNCMNVIPARINNSILITKILN